MSVYDIEPANVKTVLEKVQTQTTELSNSTKTLKDDLTSTMNAAQSQVIAENMGHLMEHEQPIITSMSNHIKACILGAAGVTTAYVKHDDSAAKTVQDQALSAAETGDFTVLEGKK